MMEYPETDPDGVGHDCAHCARDVQATRRSIQGNAWDSDEDYDEDEADGDEEEEEDEADGDEKEEEEDEELQLAFAREYLLDRAPGDLEGFGVGDDYQDGLSSLDDESDNGWGSGEQSGEEEEKGEEGEEEDEGSDEQDSEEGSDEQGSEEGSDEQSSEGEEY